MPDDPAVEAAFERAPGLVQQLRAGGAWRSIDEIVARAEALIGAMPEAERTALLDRHPRIGADPATLSEVSAREQGVAAHDITVRELAALNSEYERRFGFRFVVFVAGRSPEAIVPVLRERLGRDRPTELEAGLRAFLEIARDRLARAATEPATA